MADTVHETDALVAALSDADFDRPPALVANAHITGVSVARALAANDVPVIALDRTDSGLAPPSDAVDYAGLVTYPLDDLDGFRADVERIADVLAFEPVAFACMDEWVRGFGETESAGVQLPFSDLAGVERVLDKANLYALCEELGVPYPETYEVGTVGVDEIVEALAFPFVVKPAHKRKFEEAFGTNVIEVDDRGAFEAVVAEAREHDATVLAQERVNVEVGRDTSLASYMPPESADRDPLAVVGNAAVRFPEFGSSCLVERVEEPAVREHALTVLEETGYHGISEAEFVYDAGRAEYVLLDVNTRPWKWISMPVAAGANLPMAAYADAVDGVEWEATARDGGPSDARWVYLPDYLKRCLTDEAFWDVLSDDDWASLLSGGFEATEGGLTTGVYRPSDPAPAVEYLTGEFTDREYYCSC
jgi:predicted ATP-grasp superfamily ATP-dependent carboligase